MGIRSKLMYGFLTLAVMLFLAGIMSIVEFKNMGDSVENLLDENYASISSSQRMTESVEKCNNGILLMLVGKFDEGRKIIDNGDSVFNSNLKVVRVHVNQPGEDSVVNSIDSLYLSYRKIWLRPITGAESESKIDWYFNTANKSFSTLVRKIETLSEMNSKSTGTTNITRLLAWITF